MTISQRVVIDGVLCDVVCTGRFYFFIEKRNGRWGLVLFQPIFEKDRLDPVDPSATLKLDKELLSRYPEGYRHLAYSLVRSGNKVQTNMPGSTGQNSTLSMRAVQLGLMASRLKCLAECYHHAARSIDAR